MWWQTYLNVLVNLCFETCFWSKIDMFHISCIICLLFVIVPGLESCPFFVLVFISNFYFSFFWKCNFHAHYEACRTRTFLQSYSTCPHISIVENVNTSVANIRFWCLFLQKRSHKACRRIIQPKTNRCRNSDDTETCTSSKTYRGENVLEAIATSYKTKLQVNICLL